MSLTNRFWICVELAGGFIARCTRFPEHSIQIGTPYSYMKVSALQWAHCAINDPPELSRKEDANPRLPRYRYSLYFCGSRVKGGGKYTFAQWTHYQIWIIPQPLSFRSSGTIPRSG